MTIRRLTSPRQHCAPPWRPATALLPTPAPTTEVAELEAEITRRCCHLLPHALAGATVTSPYRRTGLCGRQPQLPAHDCGHPLALICPGCGRPRCPECALRYERTRQ